MRFSEKYREISKNPLIPFVVGAGFMLGACRPNVQNPRVDIREIPVTPGVTQGLSNPNITTYIPDYGRTVQSMRQKEIDPTAITPDELRMQVIEIGRSLIKPDYQDDLKKPDAYDKILDRTRCLDASCQNTTIKSGLSHLVETADFMQLEGRTDKNGKIPTVLVTGAINLQHAFPRLSVVVRPDGKQFLNDPSQTESVVREYFQLPLNAVMLPSNEVSSLVGLNGVTRSYFWERGNVKYCLAVDSSGVFVYAFTDKAGAFYPGCEYKTIDSNGDFSPVTLP